MKKKEEEEEKQGRNRDCLSVFALFSAKKNYRTGEKKAQKTGREREGRRL